MTQKISINGSIPFGYDQVLSSILSDAKAQIEDGGKLFPVAHYGDLETMEIVPEFLVADQTDDGSKAPEFLSKLLSGNRNAFVIVVEEVDDSRSESHQAKISILLKTCEGSWTAESPLKALGSGSKRTFGDITFISAPSFIVKF